MDRIRKNKREIEGKKLIETFASNKIMNLAKKT